MKMKMIKINPVTFEMARQMMKVLGARTPDDVAQKLIKDEFEKRGM